MSLGKSGDRTHRNLPQETSGRFNFQNYCGLHPRSEGDLVQAIRFFPPACIGIRDRVHVPMFQTESKTKRSKREICEENGKAAIVSFVGVPQSRVTLHSKNRNEIRQMLTSQ